MSDYTEEEKERLDKGEKYIDAILQRYRVGMRGDAEGNMWLELEDNKYWNDESLNEAG